MENDVTTSTFRQSFSAALIHPPQHNRPSYNKKRGSYGKNDPSFDIAKSIRVLRPVAVGLGSHCSAHPALSNGVSLSFIHQILNEPGQI